MPIIHGVGASPFVRKVRVALAEKGIQYEHDPLVPFGVPDEYKQKSPLGKIPCYEDGDFVLPDSSCIIAYLEKTSPEPRLYPEDAKQFGRALFYEEYADSKLAETTGPVFFERFVKPNLMNTPADEERVAEVLRDAVPPVFDYLEGELADDRQFLAGGQFSIADVGIGSQFVNFGHGGESVDASRWPKLAAYVERVHSRPSFKGLIEEEKASVAGA